jgi:hypothetical protein
MVRVFHQHPEIDHKISWKLDYGGSLRIYVRILQVALCPHGQTHSLWSGFTCLAGAYDARPGR